MSDSLSVSVALCTLGGARYVERQLRSILDQIPLPQQIVVSDDGSTDATLSIVERMLGEAAGRGVEVLLLDGPRDGITANFAHATAACTGAVIVLSDQDDVWLEGRIASSLRTFGSDPTVLLEHSDARLIDASGAPTGVTLFEALGVRASDLAAIRRGDAFPVFLRRNLATGATVSVRRELVERASPLPAEWLHDEWLAIIAAALGGVAVSGSRRIDYRQHDANQVGVRKPTLRYRVGRLLGSESGRNKRLAHRSGLLVDRLAALAVHQDVLEAAAAKSKVEQARAAMSTSRMSRLPVIARLLVTGDYRRYTSQGDLEAIRDLVR